jgi:hypothetical protein
VSGGGAGIADGSDDYLKTKTFYHRGHEGTRRKAKTKFTAETLRKPKNFTADLRR